MRAPLAVTLLLLAGCPKDEPPAFDPNDRTLQKLKAEQDRLSRGGQASAPPRATDTPPNPLAEAAAAQGRPEPLEVPAGTSAKVGALTLSVKRAEVSQTVAGGKVSLSTADRFVRVTLTAVTGKRETLELADAKLVNGAEEAGLARDVQKLGQGSPLSATVEPGVTQDLVLFFEAPPAMIKKGLKIILRSGESTVELPLQ